MPRRPSLEDYDAGREGVFWAQDVGRMASAYSEADEPSFEGWYGYLATGGQNWALRDLKQDPSERERMALVLREYAKHKAATKDHETRLRLRAQKDVADRKARDAEFERATRAWLEEQGRDAAEAAARRERFAAEEAEWRLKDERERRLRETATLKASARREPLWGDGVFLFLTDTVPVRWNGHPETGHIQMAAGTVWCVGPHLANAIVARGYAEVIDAS